MRLNINEEISGHKKEFLDFEKSLYTIARQRGLVVQREKKQADDDTGYMYIAFAHDGFEVAEFDIWYDFAYDYDYPDRDWFVTVKWYDESLDDGVRRTDYATFDEAKRYIDSILKAYDSDLYGESKKRSVKRSRTIKEGSRVTDSKEWFDMWFEDKKSIISIMYSNMASDLAAGYDYFGKSIQDQKAEIQRYEDEFERQLDRFKTMSEDEVNRWCFYDMKKRGAID